ncbi:hypothetical protein GQ42DRAFT_63242 [Ramicandelaber brevisporus]|nr:hypothetical protein GQ42DRAFT_63242 [Ramicandelaber brevisporus]
MPIGLALTTKGTSAPTPGAAVFDILASGETVPETALDEAAFINKNLQLLYQQHINELFPTTGDDATSFIEQLQRQADKLATDAAASSVAKDAADKSEDKEEEEEEEDGGSGMDMDMDMDVDMVETATMTVPD